VLLLALFLAISCLIAVKPAFSSSAVAVENTWTQKAPMQQARSSLGAAGVNGKIYAIGGNSENGKVGTNEEYDPATDTWTYRKSMPTARSDFATAVYENKIYCIDGAGGVNEVYDPATDTWETKTPSPTPREVASAFVMNDKIYVIGGIPNCTLNEEYDPTNDTWTTRAPMPVDSGLPQMYNPENDTWSIVPAWTSGRYVVSTSGVYAPARTYFVTYSQTQSYDFKTDSFPYGAVMPTWHDVFAVAVTDDKVYAIGGFILRQNSLSYYIATGEMYNFTWYATVEAYTPFGYGTVPPKIAVDSHVIGNYTSGNVSLAFTVNKPAPWIGYSLDGQDNVTVTRNITLMGLPVGLHNVTVYAKDKFENIGTSETVTFTITEEPPEPFPVVPVAAASVASAGVIAVGLLVYFKKHKH
jgi:hypothetical protein